MCATSVKSSKWWQIMSSIENVFTQMLVTLVKD